MRLSFALFTAVLVFLALPTTAADQKTEYDADHPLLPRYPGAELYDKRFTEYQRFDIPRVEKDPLSLTGDLTRHEYEIEGVSTLKVYQNYHHALKQAGFSQVSACKLDECGGEDKAEALAQTLAINEVFSYTRKPYFMVARKDNIHVAFFIGGARETVMVQQVILEEKPQTLGLVAVNYDYLKSALKAEPEQAEAGTLQEKDHPLLPRYPGAELDDREVTESQQFEIPLFEDDSLSLTGDLARHEYEIEGVSTLKIYQNYHHALTQAGFSQVSACKLDECGGEDKAEALAQTLAINEVFNYTRKPYFMVARKDNIHVAFFIGGHGETVVVKQVVMEEKPTQTGLVNLNMEGMKRQIDKTGRALVYGIYFDTDKAVIKDDSQQALNEIAHLLNKHPDLNLYVVGHTDDTGNVEHNLALSEQRASAVVDHLVNEHDISRSRLAPKGVGPFAPAASNESDAGKGKNRRVELVKRIDAQ